MNLRSFIIYIAVYLTYLGARAEQPEATPPPHVPMRYASSLASALKVLKGEKVALVPDIVLLDDNSIVEVLGPTSKHDAYILFGYVGCKEAVPLMIQDLKEYESAAASGKSMLCTSGHLKWALIAQTGEDFGYNREAWQRWWDTKGKDLHEEHFDPRSRNPKPANKALEPMARAVTSPAAQEPRQP